MYAFRVYRRHDEDGLSTWFAIWAAGDEVLRDEPDEGLLVYEELGEGEDFTGQYQTGFDDNSLSPDGIRLGDVIVAARRAVQVTESPPGLEPTPVIN